LPTWKIEFSALRLTRKVALTEQSHPALLSACGWAPLATGHAKRKLAVNIVWVELNAAGTTPLSTDTSEVVPSPATGSSRLKLASFA
jgi:hypothetical protein